MSTPKTLLPVLAESAWESIRARAVAEAALSARGFFRKRVFHRGARRASCDLSAERNVALGLPGPSGAHSQTRRMEDCLRFRRATLRKLVSNLS